MDTDALPAMHVSSLRILKCSNVYKSPTYALRVRVLSLFGKVNKQFDFASQTEMFVTF